jgi:hypothetical protein
MPLRRRLVPALTQSLCDLGLLEPHDRHRVPVRRSRPAGSGRGHRLRESVLAGASQPRATSLQFGPDGRLYVLHQDGTIKIYKVVRNGPNNYAVTATTTILSVKHIDNHNDDGSLNNSFVANACTSPCRQPPGSW